MISPNDERDARLLFNLIPEMTPLRFQRLHRHFGSALALWQASYAAWRDIEEISVTILEKLYRLSHDKKLPWVQEKEQALQRGLKFWIPTDPHFPPGLQALSDPPILLYLWGDFQQQDAQAVALVGTRKFTSYGAHMAKRLAQDLAKAGVVVVSGLARGIDAAAHEAALAASGRTFGVLGSGMNHFYPPEHRLMAKKMASQGGVITEFPLKTPPNPYNFPRRNRLVAGMVWGVVVVEAPEKSGALITARLAGEQGKDVFAVPGSLLSEMSRGPHLLLRQGAKLVETADDILDEIQSFQPWAKQAKADVTPPKVPMNLSSHEKKVLSGLSLEPLSREHLLRKIDHGVESLMPTLLSLEMKGFIRVLPGPAYAWREEFKLN